MELEVRPFSLRDSVETALAVVADPAAAKKVDLVYENQHSDFPDKVLGDVTRFRQILLKYNVSPPTLTLACWEMPSNNGRLFKVLITVEDTVIQHGALSNNRELAFPKINSHCRSNTLPYLS